MTRNLKKWLKLYKNWFFSYKIGPKNDSTKVRVKCGCGHILKKCAGARAGAGARAPHSAGAVGRY